MGRQQRELPPPWNSKRSCSTLRCWSGDATLTAYQGKPRKNGEGVLCQRRYRRWPVVVFYNIQPGWDQCPHLIQGAPAAREPGGMSCSSGQRSWGQNTWRGKRPRQSAQGGQQRSNTAAAAAAADTDTEAVPVRKSCKRNQTSDTWNATSPCVVTVWGERR